MTSITAIGLMSGTSLDGTDAVAERFEAGHMTRLGHVYLPYPQSLRDALFSLTLPGDNEIERMGDYIINISQALAS